MFDPLSEIAAWRDHARSASVPEPEAMVLATASAAAPGVPSARVVLCRGVDSRGVCFFTNYQSRKGRELSENLHAAAVFFWPTLGKQIRLEGDVERLTAAESDSYFAMRPRGHRLQAWASPQSQPIADFTAVIARHAELDREFAGREIPRPPYWGGYRLVPKVIEFWTDGPDRLHERLLYRRNAPGWKLERLAP